MTRSRDVSAVQNNLGVAIPPAAAGKNAVINGGMDIWQRGTSFVPTSATLYGPDRWQVYRAVAGSTVSRQSTNDTTNLPNIQYCARVQRDNGNTATNVIKLIQSFESANSIPFAGRTVTLSFYARAGANFSPTSSQIQIYLITGTGTDQNLQGGYTGSNVVLSPFQTITTTWTRYSLTGTLPTSTTEIGLSFEMNPTGTAGAADYFEITGVQLELGSSATPFSRNGSSIQGELAACQRYYVALANFASFSYSSGNGSSIMSTLPFPVTMRANPTVTVTSNGTNSGVSSVSIQSTSTTSAVLQVVASTSGHIGIYGSTAANAAIEL